MDHATAAFLSAADIKAFGPAPDGKTLEALLNRLASLAEANGDVCAWGWLCSIRDMPDEIAEAQEIPRLEIARDRAKVTEQRYLSIILDAAISVLRHP